MTGPLKLDLTRLYSSVVGENGLDAEDTDPAAARRAFEGFERRRSAGEVCPRGGWGGVGMYGSSSTSRWRIGVATGDSGLSIVYWRAGVSDATGS